MKSYQSFFNEYEYYITPSEIIEFTYCHRFSYFMKCLGIEQHEEKRFKVQLGRTVHQQKTEQNRNYLRKKIGTVEKFVDIEIVSKKYGIRGKVDEICILKDGTAVVLDYKYAKFEDKVYETYKNQLILYAIMIEEVFGKDCNKGYLIYCRDENRMIEVSISLQDKELILQEIQEYLNVINGKFPNPTKVKSRCLDCCYRNICIK